METIFPVSEEIRMVVKEGHTGERQFYPFKNSSLQYNVDTETYWVTAYSYDQEPVFTRLYHRENVLSIQVGSPQNYESDD